MEQKQFHAYLDRLLAGKSAVIHKKQVHEFHEYATSHGYIIHTYPAATNNYVKMWWEKQELFLADVPDQLVKLMKGPAVVGEVKVNVNMDIKEVQKKLLELVSSNFIVNQPILHPNTYYTPVEAPIYTTPDEDDTKTVSPKSLSAPNWADKTVEKFKATLPCECKKEDSAELGLSTLIQHLNDQHKWTYEKIADWLDTLPSQPVFYPDVNATQIVEDKDGKEPCQYPFCEGFQDQYEKYCNHHYVLCNPETITCYVPQCNNFPELDGDDEEAKTFMEFILNSKENDNPAGHVVHNVDKFKHFETVFGIDLAVDSTLKPGTIVVVNKKTGKYHVQQLFTEGEDNACHVCGQLHDPQLTELCSDFYGAGSYFHAGSGPDEGFTVSWGK